MSFLFNNLIVFEMANNHQGDVNHGIKIIKAMGMITRKYNLNAAVKFQYRDLDSFIHKDYIDRNDVKHIPRFLSTRLKDDEFKRLFSVVKEENMQTMVTPFDEQSVVKCIDHSTDIVKVASCSAKDWPLLEKVAETNKPIIISTGGSKLEDIDALVSFFQHKGCNFGLMHCVGMYPTQSEDINMNFLDKMIHRYPDVPIGWSGHEAPDNNEPVKVAVSIGAKMLERHVGIAEGDIKLNAYSMSPEQVETWIKSIKQTKLICGEGDNKNVSQVELDSLQSLKRGVYAKKEIKKGDVIRKEDIYFAMPCLNEQLSSGEFGVYRAKYTASNDYTKDSPIYEIPYKGDEIRIIRSVIHAVKGMLHEAKIVLPIDSELEISHHYGIEKLFQFGAIIFSIVNRSYCKKILICLPGQTNPMHMHKIKEETFQLLSGDLTIILDKKEVYLKPGEIFLLEPNVMHSFTSKGGAVFEEISSTHKRNDSFYQDEEIAKMDPMERKTIIKDWK